MVKFRTETAKEAVLHVLQQLKGVVKKLKEDMKEGWMEVDEELGTAFFLKIITGKGKHCEQKEGQEEYFSIIKEKLIEMLEEMKYKMRVFAGCIIIEI